MKNKRSILHLIMMARKTINAILDSLEAEIKRELEDK